LLLLVVVRADQTGHFGVVAVVAPVVLELMFLDIH
jgi:hypothetical protein